VPACQNSKIKIKTVVINSRGTPLNKRACFQVEAGASFHVKTMLNAARTRTEKGGKHNAHKGASQNFACRSVFHSR